MTTPDRTRVTVEIYGTSYKLVGSSADYMKQVANLVDERMSAISKSHSRLTRRGLLYLRPYIWLSSRFRRRKSEMSSKCSRENVQNFEMN